MSRRIDIMSKESRSVLKAELIGKDVIAPSSENLTILHPMSLRVQAGESVAIIGPSGSGKTTLLGILAGLDLPTTGRVLLDGEDMTALTEDERAALRRGRVGFVFQSFHLLASLTALENVLLPLELGDEPDSRARAGSILERVGLGERVDHYPNQLSGGEQQRVALARAFAARPKLLFADEPTGNLDAATGDRVTELLFELNQEAGTTLVLVTHSRELAARCDRTISLAGGQIVSPARDAA
ncbi:MAG: ABC transporter ATP-binding protein [Pseudomonadota bacterium]